MQYSKESPIVAGSTKPQFIFKTVFYVPRLINKSYVSGGGRLFDQMDLRRFLPVNHET